MNFSTDKYRLMAPGPVAMNEKVRTALQLPMVHHRTPLFVDTLKSCLTHLKTVFQTKNDVMMLPTTGSGAMEAAIVNTCSPGDKILCIVTGKFGERFAQISKTYGLDVHNINVPWGEAVDLNVVEEFLHQHPNTHAITCQACETSTATENPILEISRLKQKITPNAIYIVDGITAVGAMPIAMDQDGIDVLVSGSQKAFQIPTGLSFIALSEQAWKANETSKCPRYYLNVKKEREANKKGQTFFSSSVALIRALLVVLEDMTEKGIDSCVSRSHTLAESIRQGAGELGLQVYSQSPADSVTALVVPEGMDGGALRSHMEKKYNITIMGGQDHLTGKIVRIGHLGDISDEDNMATIFYLGKSLQDFGYSLTDDQIENAVNRCEQVLLQS